MTGYLVCDKQSKRKKVGIVPLLTSDQNIFFFFEGGTESNAFCRLRLPQFTVCPLVGIGTLPSPLSPASVPSPRYKRGRGHPRLRVRVLGVS
jgi:hypothetical protein